MRDDEYVFKYTDMEGFDTFVPFFKIGTEGNDKRRFLPVATDGNRHFFTALEKKPNGKMKVIYYNKTQAEEVTYTINNNGVISPPPGWHWVSVPERKNLYGIFRKLEHTRNVYSQFYIDKGFISFWKKFNEIALPILEKSHHQASHR